MKIKVAQYITDFLVNKGVEHIFTVTGGGAMHLNDAFGHKEGLACIYNHHEQASSMAAEGYARLTGKIAAVCVTSGPGGTNAITGVLGGWQDSIPMFIISGQVKRETTTWSTNVPLRQLGDQEFQIVDCVKNMVKYTYMVTEPTEIRYHMEKAWYFCMNGRKGPVWLDIPIDVQAAIVDTDELKKFIPSATEKKEQPVYQETLTKEIIKHIKAAKRPVIIAGTGIRLGDAHDGFLSLVEKLRIPTVTAWNAHDVLWQNNSYFCGRPGSVGTRGGNFVVQNSDLLLILGCRLNIRQISYNYKEFAKHAYKIMVDIDEAELKKPTIQIDMPIYADVKDVINSLLTYEDNNDNNQNHDEWLKWCRDINQKYPATLTCYYENEKLLNPYVFFTELSKELKEEDKVICGNGSACVIGFQAMELKKGQRLFTNSGCAAMGYGFPAALGCAVAEKGKRVICIDGDGSFQMNLQELQTVVYNHLNLKIFIINNNGYHSIRQTQTNLFAPPLVGVCDGNGISFPNLEKLAYAYEIPYVKIVSVQDIGLNLKKVLEMPGAVLCEVMVDPSQNFEPKLSSRLLPDGKIISPEIDDMFPFLSREEYTKNKFII